MRHFIYMLASRLGGALYLGHDAATCHRRVGQHRARAISAHTARYNIHTLGLVRESTRTGVPAFEAERRMKRWRRAWKIDCIMEANPDWRDICHLIPD